MTPAVGPFAIAATLLALGGLLKAVRPADTAHALATAGIPLGPLAIRVGGALEAVIAIWALVTADRWSAAAVAASYVAFTGFVVSAMMRDLPISSCGCFGKVDTPPSLAHVVVNIGATVAAVVVAVDPGAGLGDVLADQPVAGVGFVILVAAGVLLAFSALTDLPKVLSARPSTRAFSGDSRP